MQNYARIAGYSVTLSFLAILLFVTLQLREGMLFPNNRVQVRFSSIGTLMEDDAVKLNGVQVGRVEQIEAGSGAAIVTLELFQKQGLPKDSRFINYNYSLFGARMVILVPGTSPEMMDQKSIQEGYFISGVTESIHKVDLLLNTILQYQSLSKTLQIGQDSTPSLQQILTAKVYPTLESFSQFAEKLQSLEKATVSELETLARTTGQVNGLTRTLGANADSLVLRADRTLEALALLSVQSTVLLQGLENIILTAQDTTHGTGRFLMQRDIYDRSLALTQGLESFVQALQKEGVTDLIHFWRNVHIHLQKQKEPKSP